MNSYRVLIILINSYDSVDKFILWIIMLYLKWITQHSVYSKWIILNVVSFTLNNIECCVIHSEYYMIIQSEYATWRDLSCPSRSQSDLSFHLNFRLYIYTYIGSDSNENSFFIMNVRTTESAARSVFILNNHVLFEANNTTFNVIQSE